jgi:hypothetical protein
MSRGLVSVSLLEDFHEQKNVAPVLGDLRLDGAATEGPVVQLEGHS